MTIEAEEDPVESPDWLIENIAEVVKKVVPPPKGPPIGYDFSVDEFGHTTE